MVDWRDAVVKIIFAIIIIVIAVVAIILLTGGVVQPKEQPNLQVSLQTLSGKTGDSPTLYFKVTNTGGDAQGVVVSISSSAFSQGSTDKIDISADHAVDVTCRVNINDVASDDYPVTITYTYDGGNITSVSNPPLFHVVPSLEIVNQHWFWPFGAIQEKSTIGPNDDTTLYFKIKSDTSFLCTDLSIHVAAQTGTTGLTITPNTLQIDPIGPTGTSGEYSISFKSTDMPPGTYTIDLKVFSGAYEAGTLQVILWVNA